MKEKKCYNSSVKFLVLPKLKLRKLLLTFFFETEYTKLGKQVAQFRTGKRDLHMRYQCVLSGPEKFV